MDSSYYSSFNAAFSIAASIMARVNRNKAKRRIKRLNEERKNIFKLGNVYPENIIPNNQKIGNVIISGSTKETRDNLIIQNCRQSVNSRIPVIILHEGNHHLEQMLQSSFYGHRFLRIINATNSYYDPIHRLNDMEIGHFTAESSLGDHKIDSSDVIYIKALCEILRKRGITPYSRMLASCPHGKIPKLTVQMEQSGILSTDEADRLRSELSGGAKAQIEVEVFWQRLELESPILAWKSDLSKCTSISECIQNKGVMAIDIISCGRLSQLAFISTEIEHCARMGIDFRIIVDALSFPENDKLSYALKNSSQSLLWTLSSPDINRLIGNNRGDLSSWLASSHLSIFFSHGIKTSELLSAELGMYEQINIAESNTGNHSYGRMGYHWGSSSSISTSTKRTQIIQPEEIESLGDNSFIMLDNYTATISQGTLI